MKIAVVGSYGAGLTMRVSRAPAAGETVSGGRYDEGPGGKGSNQAVGAARLGAEVALLTAVGDDAFGRAAKALWDHEKVDASRVLTTPTPTMVGFIVVDESGENRITIAPGALDDLDEDAVEGFRDQIAAAQLVIVSLEIPLDTAVAALRIGREVGTTTLLNPAPAVRLPAEAWDLIDILTPNETEAPVILGLDPSDLPGDAEIVAELVRRTGGAVVLTRGSRGALVGDAAGVGEIPPHRVDTVVDTTGAGDCFTAALAVALAEGKPLRDAAAFASVAGALAVTTPGVVPALPTRDQIAHRIAHRIAQETRTAR